MSNTKGVYSDEEVAEHAYRVRTLGYSVIEGFLQENECLTLRSHLQKAIDSYERHSLSERSIKDKYHMHDLLCKDVIFLKTLEDVRLQHLIAPLLDQFWIMYAYTSSSLPPRGDNYGSRIHVDSPRFIPNYITNVGIIWALDDFTLDNGATYIMPGSHSVEKVPSDDFFKANSIRLTCKRGALVIFNARLWHAAGVNSTNEFRHALTLNACRPYMKQRMDWVRFIPEQLTNQLNDQARRIVGFDTRIPSNLEEFFQPIDKLFYKPGQE